jgi:hypothetical protein
MEEKRLDKLDQQRWANHGAARVMIWGGIVRCGAAHDARTTEEIAALDHPFITDACCPIFGTVVRVFY